MIWTIIIPLMAIIAVLTFWMIFQNGPRKYQQLSINKVSYRKSLKKNEIRRTIISLLIFAFVGGIIDFFEYTGWSRLYIDFSSFSFLYLGISIFLLLGINDIYFYFSHRFLHWKPIFKSVHYVHHQSNPPNPFSAFSFHPIEGLVQIGFIPLVVLILPLNSFVLFGFITFLMFMSVYGHSGYELRPRKAKFFEIFNNSIHHNQHHRFVHYNFGLYLNLWDRIFKTNHPTYEEETKLYSDVKP